MDRKEKETRILRQDGKVFEIRDLRIDETYRSADYILSKLDAPAMTPTGHLVIFELRPVAGSGPSFVARWDGGSRDAGKHERYDLDIDIHGVSRAVTHQFENGERGYSGHHSMKVPTAGGRAYQVCVRTPQMMIFNGIVSFAVLRKMEIAAATAPFDANVSPHKRRTLWSGILGVVLVVFGGIWFLQGVGVLPGSFMTGQIRWAVYGGIAVAAGVSLLLAARRRSG